MNKAAAAGIGIAVVVIAISVLFMMTSEESDVQTEISDETDASEESKSYEVDLEESLDVGDTP